MGPGGDALSPLNVSFALAVVRCKPALVSPLCSPPLLLLQARSDKEPVIGTSVGQSPALLLPSFSYANQFGTQHHSSGLIGTVGRMIAITGPYQPAIYEPLHYLVLGRGGVWLPGSVLFDRSRDLSLHLNFSASTHCIVSSGDALTSREPRLLRNSLAAVVTSGGARQALCIALGSKGHGTFTSTMPSLENPRNRRPTS